MPIPAPQPPVDPPKANQPLVMLVAGARPNFMKVAPVHRALLRRGRLRPYLVHTGQHHDVAMSDIFFRDLGLPQPDAHLGIAGGTHSGLTARIMLALEDLVQRAKPDLMVVVGDVNSTLAAALVAVQAGIPLAHVEAGLRSRDLTMPEETNRMLTDRVADLLFATEADAVRNLAAEGVPPERVHLVGNVMIDSLFTCRPSLTARAAPKAVADLVGRPFALTTLHRPANVDDPAVLGELLAALRRIASRIPVIWPLHPRTRKRLAGLAADDARLRLTEPLGYLDFLSLLLRARLVLTDSGGIQDETTAIGVPCLTLRENTERPITIELGTNQLVGRSEERIVSAAEALLAKQPGDHRLPPLWDGQAAERIAPILEAYLHV